MKNKKKSSDKKDVIPQKVWRVAGTIRVLSSNHPDDSELLSTCGWIGK